MSIIHELKDPFPHLIVENMYDEEELELIWEELKFLTKPGKLLNPEEYGVAGAKYGNPQTTALGIQLDNIYTDRNFSNILNLNRKLFNYTQIYSKLSPHYIKFERSNSDITKIRYYHDGESYSPHADVKYDTLVAHILTKLQKNFLEENFIFQIITIKYLVIITFVLLPHHIFTMVCEK